MEEMRQRFDEIVKYEKKEKMFICKFCPCYEECIRLSAIDYSCEDMYFAYITLGKDFHLQKEKILKNS